MVFTIASSVRIRDRRLNVLYYTLLFVTGFCILTGIIVTKAWMSAHRIADNEFKVSPYVVGMNYSTLEDIRAKKSKSPFCASPEDFWYDWRPWLRLRPTGCLRACLPDRNHNHSPHVRGPCTLFDDLYDVRREQIFIPTLRRIEHADAYGVKRTSELFSPFAESLKIAFTFNVATEIPVWHIKKLMPEFAARQSKLTAGHSQKDIISFVFDSDNHVDSVWNRSPTLRIPEILRLSGKGEGFLDHPVEDHDINPNMSQQSRFPIPRVTGAAISVKIDCSDVPPETTRKLVEERRIKVEDVSFWCTLRFAVQHPRQWGELVQSYPHGFDNTKETRFQYDLGLEFVVVTSGTILYINPVKMFTMIASTIVFMRIPLWFMVFFMTYCLGHLSTIYTRYLFRDISVANSLVGNAMRILVYTGRLGSISRICRMCTDKDAKIGTFLASELQSAAREHGETDKIDTTAFADFVSEAVASTSDIKLPCSKIIPCIKKALKVKHCDVESEATKIDLLLAAADSTELRTFTDAERMFGVDRKFGLLEKIFLPPFFKKAFRCRERNTCSNLTPPPNDNQDDENIEVPPSSLVLPRLSLSSDLVRASLNLDLEQRMELHRAEVDEKIRDLREILDNMMQRLVRLEVGSVSHASDVVVNVSGSHEGSASFVAASIRDCASCAQELDQPTMQQKANSTQHLGGDLRDWQNLDALLTVSTSLVQFRNDERKASGADVKDCVSVPTHLDYPLATSSNEHSNCNNRIHDGLDNKDNHETKSNNKSITNDGGDSGHDDATTTTQTHHRPQTQEQSHRALFQHMARLSELKSADGHEQSPEAVLTVL